jgi:hypothetical protein
VALVTISFEDYAFTNGEWTSHISVNYVYMLALDNVISRRTLTYRRVGWVRGGELPGNTSRPPYLVPIQHPLVLQATTVDLQWDNAAQVLKHLRISLEPSTNGAGIFVDMR